MSSRSAIQDLADRAGILSHYRDQRGRQIATSNTSRVALLEALGFAAASERAAKQSLQQLDAQDRLRLIEPVEVLRFPDPRIQTLRVQLPDAVKSAARDYRISLTAEGEDALVTEGRLQLLREGFAQVEIPRRLGLGYHSLEITVAGPGGSRCAEQMRIVCPRSCTSVATVLGSERGFGLWTNLYTLRSDSNYGVGDLTDLNKLASWATELGAAFVGVNPLHSLWNRGQDISPYSPISRLFRNEIYLDVTAVPEFKQCRAAQELVASDSFTAELRQLRSRSQVDYQRAAELKRQVLQLLHRQFMEQHLLHGTRRAGEFQGYIQSAGSALTLYATFRALDDHLVSHERMLGGWPNWPSPLRDPHSTAVKQFQREHAWEIDYHRYLQFELDRQVGLVAENVTPKMPIGIYADLALGVHPNGCDTWAFKDHFVSGVHIGAPPDDFAPSGQDWGLPPIAPMRLRENRYHYWIQVIRSCLRGAGALRIDHVMGLFRQFWIPKELSGSRGAYIRFPAHELLGILALESTRHRAVVVGEDLGTVPPGLQVQLSRWGILSSRVLYFERDRRGRFRPLNRYSDRALVTANTHDQAPLAGYWSGRDLKLRQQVGAYADDYLSREAVEQRDSERRALIRRLHQGGFITGTGQPLDPTKLSAAVYAFLAQTPAPLLGVSLDDLAGEVDPVNLPGIAMNRFPNWSRRMSVSLEELFRGAATKLILDGVAARAIRSG